MVKKYEEQRPWGRFEQFVTNETCTVKILIIEPGQTLSLQYHRRRDEFWKVLDGHPIVEIGGMVYRENSHDEFFVPRESLHRISVDANGMRVRILEISFGIFDEADIVRLEDKYGRESKV